MRYTILLLTLCLFTLSSYAGGKELIKPIPLDDLKSGKVKDTSTPVDAHHFFQWQMLNEKAYKMVHRNRTIFFETDTFVYYGTGDKYIYQYYKTDKKKLATVFPTYQSVKGYQLRDIVATNDKVLHPPLTSYSIQEYTYAIADNKILVGAKYKRGHQLFPVNARFITYYTYIDMHTLEVKPMP